ncbi:DUF1049 domain-containing protein [Actinomycetospora sp. CA-053990]|uniref:DUF1049 domain-containing protein n=1 Tax=Actinomycetospora sp. CA-053990 TaxID=3239891 RepID=UPI003D8BB77A
MTDGSAKPKARSASTGRSGWTTRRIGGVVLAVAAIVFILENRDPATIRLLIPLVIMPQWAALALMLVIGAAIGWLLARSRPPK